MFDNITSVIVQMLFNLPAILIALTVHEVSHGYVAYRLGDPTARNLGRLTLNPLKHLDPIGFICMFFFRFGWAKPVPINTRYFKNPRRDMAITALAGPVSNIAMAFIGVLLHAILYKVFTVFPATGNFAAYVQSLSIQFTASFCMLNLTLAVFNLIPVPPLDGSRIFLVFLSPEMYFGVMKYERYISLALLICLWTGVLTRPLSVIVNWILNGMQFIVGLIPFL